MSKKTVHDFHLVASWIPNFPVVVTLVLAEFGVTAQPTPFAEKLSSLTLRSPNLSLPLSKTWQMTIIVLRIRLEIDILIESGSSLGLPTRTL